MNLSIVIPVYNEEGSVDVLGKEVVDVVDRLHLSYEVIFVNDGSTDNTQKRLEDLQKRYAKKMSIITLRVNIGKAAAYNAGFSYASGDVIITLDGDGQDDPKEIYTLIQKLRTGYDCVVGWKQHRRDSFIKNTTSKVFNAVTSSMSPVKLHDFNCGLKAYTREAIQHLLLYGELHRYIPVLLASQGFRVTEVPVHHRVRRAGKSKYGPIRFINGFLDLLTVYSLTKFRSRPMHLFGYIGSIFFSFGFLIGIYLTFIKFTYGQAIGDRPLLLFSVMLMIMGVQITITGLMGEYLVMSGKPSAVEKDISCETLHE